MTTGRTLKRWTRFYMDGYDLSNYIAELGPLQCAFEEDPLSMLGESVQGSLPGFVMQGIGMVNGVFDSTVTSGLHVIANGAGQARTLMIPIGIQGEPAADDNVYCTVLQQLGYHGAPAGKTVMANIPFGMPDVATGLNYSKPWGKMVHVNGAETAENEAAGIDGAAATTAGGYMAYQVFACAGEGTVVITVEDASTNSDANFGALSGATTGELAHSAIPCAGIVQLATTATVKRYLRWQIALTDITSVTFALAFVRG